jgi:hypothetical protein
MKLSDQALGAIMMALQNALMSQTDITPVLKSFDMMVSDNEELIVLNPPVTETGDLPFREKTSTVGSD